MVTSSFHSFVLKDNISLRYEKDLQRIRLQPFTTSKDLSDQVPIQFFFKSLITGELQNI